MNLSIGGMHGYAINLVRDFCFCLFSAIAGFKNNGLIRSTVWIVLIIAPIMGALIGAGTDDLVIGRVLEREQTKQDYRQELK